jgi:hypothetical protein
VCSGPVVLLEVQMHPDPGFHHRLAAQSSRFLQKHPQVEHLEELSQQANLDPLLTLPVRLESELPACTQQILASRPDLDTSKSW